MELARAGEALLRSSQPLLPFLAPAACRQPSRRVATISRHCRTQPLQKTSTRAFTTSLRLREDEKDQKKPEEPHPDSLSKQSSSTDEISSLLDSTLDFNKGTPTTPAKRTTRFASNTNQHNNSPSRAAAASNAAANKGSSMDDMLSALLKPAPSRPSGRRSGSISSYTDPNGNSRAPPPPAIAAEAPMKLGPTLGRTVYVDKDRGFDVARAFRTMEIQVARNAVRRDFNRQRFHERGGMKRKRLKSERWRRRFKEGFRAVVRRVLKMRKQGW